jgi:hypothetical protein
MPEFPIVPTSTSVPPDAAPVVSLQSASNE